MSKGIRRPGAQSPFETKQVIVAACAGIAMVLGATSVGAGVGDTPQTTASSTKTRVSSIISTEIKTDNSKPDISSAAGSLAKLTSINDDAYFEPDSHALYGPIIPSVTTKPLQNTAASVFNRTSEALNIVQRVVPEPAINSPVLPGQPPESQVPTTSPDIQPSMPSLAPETPSQELTPTLPQEPVTPPTEPTPEATTTPPPSSAPDAPLQALTVE